MKGEMKTERITTMMSPGEVQALDDWAFANRIRSRSEAIRRLIEAGLKAGDKISIQGSKPEPSSGSDVTEDISATPKRARSPRTQKTAPISKETQLPALRE